MRRIVEQHSGLQPQIKERFKMYKAGKRWLFAGIAFLGTSAVLFGGGVAHADDQAPAADTTPVAQVSEQGQDAASESSTEPAPQAEKPAPKTEDTAADASKPAVQTETQTDSGQTGENSAPATAQAQVTPTSTAKTQEGAVPASDKAAVVTADSAQEKPVPAAAVTRTDATKATLNLQAEQPAILSGENASFDVKLDVTGIVADGRQQRLVLDLPAGYDLADGSDLSIEGVTPTLDATTHQLVYNFTTPQNGLTLSKRFEFKTTSGSVVNGSKVKLKASFMNGEDVTEAGEQSVTVNSKANLAVSNQVIGVMVADKDGKPIQDASGNVVVDGDKISGYAGDVVAYQFGVSAPNKELGQAYFDPGTIVKVRYQLPKGLDYINVDSSTAQPADVIKDGNGNTTLTWYIQAPSLAAQIAADGNLLAAQFKLIAQINESVPYNTKLTTQAIAGGQTINGDMVTSAIAKSTMQTVPNFNKDTLPTDGTDFYFYNWGPADGEGNLAPHVTAADPQVGPNANLAYFIMVGPTIFHYHTQTWGPNIPVVGDGKPIQQFDVTYDVDDHLNVNTMTIDAPTATVWGIATGLDEMPKFDLYVRYQGEADYDNTPILQDITDTGGKTLDMNSLLDNSRGVAELKFVWTTIAQGQTYSGIWFNMSPKAGYYGTVANNLRVDMAGQTAAGWMQATFTKDGAYYTGVLKNSSNGYGHIGQEIHMIDSNGQLVAPGSAGDRRAIYNQYMKTQTAEIVKPAENEPRVINESLGFANTTDQGVSAGDNVLNVYVENNKAAVNNFSGLKSYVVLPEGVTYTGSDSQVTATQVGGKTLLTINWQQDALAPNSGNRLNLGVHIDPGLNLRNLNLNLYSTVNEKDTLVPKNINAQDPSDVQKMADGLKIDGLTLDQPVYALNVVAQADNQAGNLVHAQTFAENQAGQKGAEVTVHQGETATLGFNLTPGTDGALQDFELVATLPSPDDTAVLDDTARGTTTNAVTLTGPVQLPAGWDQATVVYVTAAHPEGIPANQVTDFGQVTGFKISYTDATGYLPGHAVQLLVPVKVGAGAAVGSKAYISYAVKANGLQQTEGLKAGIVIAAADTGGGTPTGPTEPTGPTTPTTPVGPTTPTEPGEPTTPDEPNIPSVPVTPDLPSTGGETTPNRGNGQVDLPSTLGGGTQTGRTATGRTRDTVGMRSRSTSKQTLPQTGDGNSSWLAVVGLALMGLLSGAWFKKRTVK
ncbi:KxYKxGKxW signal peptide domain-containing protein [Lacticaseibacillus pabuli]|uniref:KxYKxGKxW signal peptide domain-containing protein n=1 Tax=Lacticaseibacillus pabuli TaxID=3025672 RepID=A0ABY7WS41_9LACO|nr:KxYKxGKxW signal peptide domain-containing protein [Lacticaseibacillus sp. KACC 23028]WDF82936.1 KxYKxGKxW signal peptide domain-containing protein [Lacticaseibacillus sp. KACC 23028]